MALNMQSGLIKTDCAPPCSTVPMAARNESRSKCERFCSLQGGQQKGLLEQKEQSGVVPVFGGLRDLPEEFRKKARERLELSRKANSLESQGCWVVMAQF
jgi:hypothetical protein